MKKTYLFDFDGTLVDSMPTYFKGLLNVLDEFQIPYSDDIVKIVTPLGYPGTARYFQSLGVPLSEDEIVRRFQDYSVNAYTNSVPAKKNVVETLRILKEQGHSLNVLTASPHTQLDPCLKRLGIMEWFDHVWSCNDFNTTKADPEIYKRAAKQMGVPVKEVIFLDDNYNADKTAKEAGMIVYGVYDSYSEPYLDEIKALVDKFIYDFKELL